MNGDKWNKFNYPPNMIKIAEERLEGLLQKGILKHHSIQKIVVSAYLQGWVDSLERLRPLSLEEAEKKFEEALDEPISSELRESIINRIINKED